jgi:hypothetical protein
MNDSYEADLFSVLNDPLGLGAMWTGGAKDEVRPDDRSSAQPGIETPPGRYGVMIPCMGAFATTFEIQFPEQAIVLVLSILAHHDDGCLDGGQHEEK